MLRSFYISILLLASVFITSAQNRIEASNALLESLIANNEVMGASGAYAIKGKIIWAEAVGYANKEKNRAFNLDTRVRTASIAKSMTAVAIMQLVEQNQLNLDTPINDYFPEFVQKGKTKITTRHLLSHTSGIGAYKNNKETENKIDYPTLLDAYGVFKDRKLRFEPGTSFYYTSYGYVVLGILIEKVSGISFERYMQQYIWDKANMPNTGIEKLELSEGKSATLYHKSRKGKIDKAGINNLSNRVPAGGFYSTALDLVNFGNALVNNELVKAETLELMTEHHSLEKINNGYGYGFYLYGSLPNEDTIIGHNGAQSGTSTQLFVIPKLKTVIAVVANTSGSGREVSTVAGKLIDISQKMD